MRLTHKQLYDLNAATWNGGNPYEMDLRMLANGAVRAVPVLDNFKPSGTGTSTPQARTVQRDGTVKVG